MDDSRFDAAIEVAIQNGWVCEIGEDEIEDEIEDEEPDGRAANTEEVAPANEAAWIPTTERMPPDLPDYRIIVSDGKHSESAYSGTLYCNPEGVLIAPARHGWGMEVLWWMPWPRLPVIEDRRSNALRGVDDKLQPHSGRKGESPQT